MLQLSYKSTVTNSQMPKIHLNEIHEKIMMAIIYVLNTWSCMAEFDRDSH